MSRLGRRWQQRRGKKTHKGGKDLKDACYRRWWDRKYHSRVFRWYDVQGEAMAEDDDSLLSDT